MKCLAQNNKNVYHCSQWQADGYWNIQFEKKNHLEKTLILKLLAWTNWFIKMSFQVCTSVWTECGHMQWRVPSTRHAFSSICAVGKLFVRLSSMLVVLLLLWIPWNAGIYIYWHNFGNLNTSNTLWALITPALIKRRFKIVRYIKRSLFPFLMGIFFIKLDKRKGYMLRMQYTTFRKKITFQKHGIPFFKWLLLRRPL